ncbi:hypothetical protein C0V75_21645 [Tabrizicola sp. TH137]|uniref:AAA family ATPase n=1 Tax=Tabrizicola sp. TH137 TaxID=2067452 RepID=UPI000C7C6390|nr:AAA family ATPase [Tabrizicola sp. TH137]PLL10244.1 hypothetical protein C0V75_21645 [Tabrizicola sp. TH137]
MEPSEKTSSTGPLNSNTLSKRKAFRLVLQDKWNQEVHGVKLKTRSNLYFELHAPDMENEGSSDCGTSAAAAGEGAPQKLRLPWMPTAAVVADLVAVGGLADALETQSAVLRVLEPAHLTHVVMPLLEDDSGGIVGAIKEALILWTGRFGPWDLLETEPKIVVCSDAQDTTCRVPQSLKQLGSRVENYLRSGNPVILITASEELFAPLRRHVGLTLRCSRMNRALVVEIICALHRKAARLGPATIRDRLPDDHLLARLTTTQLQAALRLTSPDQLFGRLKAHAKVPAALEAVTLDKVRGQREAVGHLKRMLSDLQAWQAGALKWSEANMSAVLYGPPGNGKTMIAEAFAGSAGIPLHVTSYSDCQRHGHQGDMLKALNDAFRAAEASVPSVLFIDEIDSFSDRSREGSNDQYLRGVVNGLLTHLTRAAATPGLVLLAATNDLSIVDPAVIRPGRFDLRIPVGNPDKEGIREILSDHLSESGNSEITAADLEAASIELVGSSGATVASKAREVLGRARAANRPVTRDDLDAVLRAYDPNIRNEHLRRMAVHEAGHVIVRALSTLPAPKSVRIGGGGGLVEMPALPFLTPETADEVLQELLAGRAAERLVMGSISSGAGHGTDSDLANATTLAVRMHSEWGFAPGAPIWQPAANLMQLGLPRAIQSAVEERLLQAEAAAERVLLEHMDALLGLSETLIKQRELSADEILSVLDKLGLPVGAHGAMTAA